MKKNKQLHAELNEFISLDNLNLLRKKDPLKHFEIALRQLIFLFLVPGLIIYFKDAIYLWLPLSILEGFIIFSFSVLLHEVIHKNIFKRRNDNIGIQNMLGLIYSTIAGMSYSQFLKWHMDHHKFTGDSKKDPKKARLSPKKNKRWIKLLYGTPALFFIYFRSVKKTVENYPFELKKRIRLERIVTISIHLFILILLLNIAPEFCLKIYLIPVFIGFPLAFFMNRMGQHYIIDPDDEAKGATLMLSNPMWDFLFLYSTYHLEHHYYPNIPFYNLRKCHKTLNRFYNAKGIKYYSYTEVFQLWIFQNHRPHSKPNLSK